MIAIVESYVILKALSSILSVIFLPFLKVSIQSHLLWLLIGKYLKKWCSTDLCCTYDFAARKLMIMLELIESEKFTTSAWGTVIVNKYVITGLDEIILSELKMQIKKVILYRTQWHLCDGIYP